MASRNEEGGSISETGEVKDVARASGGGWCCLPMQLVLLVLGFLGASIEFILRFSIGVAIVAMVNTTTTNNDTISQDACPAVMNASHSSQSTGGGEYDWSLQEQGIILGTFFWGYFITKFVGGRIAELVGGRVTMGVTLGLCGVMSLLCPLAASWHPLALAAVRLLMGLLQGPAVPALYSVIARWARPKERASMLLVLYAGMGTGLVIGLGLSGLVIDGLGWRWAFYGGGILALIWMPFWFLLVRDSPNQHPFISAKEKELLSEIAVEPKRRVPWSRMVCCRTIYILILVEFSSGWLQVCSSVQAPTFLADQVGMDLVTSGHLMLVATTATSAFCFIYGWLSDFIYGNNWLSKINTRRFIYIAGGVLIVGSSVGIVLAGCDQNWIFALYIILLIGVPSQPAAYQLTPIDIAPNYSSTIIGILGLGQLGGFLAPIVNSHIIPLDNGWNIVFLLNSLVYTVIGSLYVFGVTAEEQEWNFYEEPADCHDKENVTLCQEGTKAILQEPAQYHQVMSRDKGDC